MIVTHQNRDATAAHLWLQGLTLSRLPVALAFGWALGCRESFGGWFVLCLGLLMTVELSDFLDGHLARRYVLISPLGELLDPLADSLSRSTIYFFLAVSGAVWAIVPQILLARDLVVSYCRTVSVSGGVTVASNLSGKLKAVVQALGAFAALWALHRGSPEEDWVAGISWTVTLVTLASMLQYLGRAVEVLRSDSQAK